jgi:S1 domain
VRTNGFIVFVPKYGIEGPVYLAEKGAAADASWAMDEEKQLVTSPDSQTRCGGRSACCGTRMPACSMSAVQYLWQQLAIGY